MADIGSLIVKIGADASGLQKAFSDLGGSAKQFQRGMEQVGKITATAFLAATTAAIGMTIAAGKQAEELDQLAAATGINTDKLQEYDVMLNRAGLNGQDLAVIMKNVSTSLDQAKQGTGTAGDRFRQLGINIRTVTGSDDLLRKIATASSTFADGMGKTAIMTDLLGKSWQQAIKLFQDGEKGLNALSAASKNLGETLSTSQLATLKQMDDQIDDVSLAYKRFGQQLGVSLAPNIKFFAELVKDMMVSGAAQAAEFGLAWDVLGTKILHFGLQMKEVGGTLFSTGVFSPDAWKSTMERMKAIGAESDKQVAKLRLAFELARVVEPLGAGKKPPPDLIDTSKISQQQQALIDAQLKASEGLFKNQDALAKANLTNYMAILDAAKEAGIQTDEEVATAKQAALEKMDVFTVDSLNRQLANYKVFSADKMKLFTDDEKGLADRTKFAVEASQKEKDLISQIGLAQVAADTTRIQSGAALLAATKKTRLIPLEDEITLAKADFALQQAFYSMAPGLIGAADAARQKGMALIEAEGEMQRQVIEQTIADEQRKTTLIIALDGELQAKRMAMVQQFPTFWEKQMRDVVASNAFSVSQIITSWTSGVANAIVNGGDFVKQAWQATQIAIVQGAINTGVQLAAQWAIQASVEAGILTKSQGEKILGHTLMEETKTEVTAAQEAARMAVVLAGTKAMAAANAATTAGIATAGLAALGVMEAALEGIVGFMLAVAAAVAEVPLVGQALAGSLIVGATLAQVSGSTAIGTATAAIAGAAAAAAKGIAFGKGGIAFGPSIFGEAGPEAAIPLDARGASFMREAFGMGESKGQFIQTTINLDGREFAKVMSERMPGALRTMGAL